VRAVQRSLCRHIDSVFDRSYGARAVAKELKRTEDMATEHPSFPEWCQMTVAEDGSKAECNKVGRSPLRVLFPSVLRGASARCFVICSKLLAECGVEAYL
jgi:hypothetical protein